MSFSHLWGAPATSRGGDQLTESLWYVQRGAKNMSSALYRSGLGTLTLRVFLNGVEYYQATGLREPLQRDAAEKLRALLAKGWEEIPA